MGLVYCLLNDTDVQMNQIKSNQNQTLVWTHQIDMWEENSFHYGGGGHSP